MELTDEQRAELGRVATPAGYARDSTSPKQRGRAAINARKRERERLRQLADAWIALDPTTQEDVLAHIVSEWEDWDQTKPLPDVGRIAVSLRELTAAPARNVEGHPGLTEATKLLWQVWITDQPGVVEIDRAAVSAIAGETARAFQLTQAEAERRTGHILRSWDKAGGMPGRGTGKTYREGVRVA